jgi:hypothetical protein
MIQRIQTVYLLISAILVALLSKLQLADLIVDEKIYSFISTGIYSGEERIYNGMPILILVTILTLIHLVAIFQYKKRILQIRMLVFSIILLLGLFGMFFFFAYIGFEGAKASFKVPVAFPLVAIILDYLAIRAIGKDEALIRSLNRIR